MPSINAENKTEMRQKVKIIVGAVVALLVVVVVLQNTEALETRIQFTTITMPRAALLFGTLVVGFGLGIYSAVRQFFQGSFACLLWLQFSCFVR